MKIKKMFDDSAKEFGTVSWNGVKLALTEEPYPIGLIDDWYFYAHAMDEEGNLWEVCWDIIPGVDSNVDYFDQVEDWDKPFYAEMIDKGYYLD